MNKYQIMNDQHQSVKTFDLLNDAKRYIASLQETYNEGFYIIEHKIVFECPPLKVTFK